MYVNIDIHFGVLWYLLSSVSNNYKSVDATAESFTRNIIYTEGEEDSFF